MTYFHEPSAPVVRCVTCRRLFTGTVADVVAGYRNHQCAPLAALFDPPHPYTNVGVKK